MYMVINMVNMQETTKLESIDIILQNLKKDPEYYNHAKEEQFSRFDRDD